ncbi:Tetratricopeptide repeat-domain-containing protein [Ilyonectria robusta]|uniref:Tetratricopeptide repeat-domain-containing protein n=1 Tax=Ilyonectria robusta TaxID=1079257 RepID=UPI001E8EDDD8|nr:Tetratricopeptide repeat-domain-containing protein [Ilyonectria robusta]KAH8729996.1 Tetratricopeptide repeat-domain-containing protein [Ilyonectria robusta]
MTDIASILEREGKYEMAAEKYREILEIQKEILGASHPNADPDTLASTNRLMLDLVKQGKYGEAEKMGWEILARRQNALGPKHPDTLTSMSNLAVVLKKQERYPEAEQMARRTLELRTGVLGQDHPDTLKSLNNLAVLLACMGEYGKAELMLRETVVLRENLLGKGHSHTGVSRANLASVLELRRRDDGSHDGRYMRVNLEKLQHISVSGVNEQADSL